MIIYHKTPQAYIALKCQYVAYYRKQYQQNSVIIDAMSNTLSKMKKEYARYSAMCNADSNIQRIKYNNRRSNIWEDGVFVSIYSRSPKVAARYVQRDIEESEYRTIMYDIAAENSRNGEGQNAANAIIYQSSRYDGEYYTFCIVVCPFCKRKQAHYRNSTQSCIYCYSNIEVNKQGIVCNKTLSVCDKCYLIESVFVSEREKDRGCRRCKNNIRGKSQFRPQRSWAVVKCPYCGEMKKVVGERIIDCERCEKLYRVQVECGENEYSVHGLEGVNVRSSINTKVPSSENDYWDQMEYLRDNKEVL